MPNHWVGSVASAVAKTMILMGLWRYGVDDILIIAIIIEVYLLKKLHNNSMSSKSITLSDLGTEHLSHGAG